MPGLFQGLEIGKRALLTHQYTLQTIGHNIANVNTPGFTRQRVNITSSQPEYNTVGTIGSGVQVADIRQIRDLFLGEQFRQESKSLGQWTYKEKVISQIESLFGEPGDNTLSGLLNDFWNAWSDLATTNSVSTREALVGKTELLTNGFHQLANQLQALRSSIDGDLINYTAEINRLSGEIARMNDLIKSQELGNTRANDLRDARDLVIDELSQIVDINTVEQPNSTTTVYIGAMVIVDGSDVLPVSTKTETIDGVVTNKLVWKGTEIELTNINGQLRGLVDARDKIIPGYLDDLNAISASLIREVNALHTTGFGLDGSAGVNFFDNQFIDASNITVNREITDNSSRIVASASGEVGDNTIALAIQDLRSSQVMNNNSITINDFYNSLVGKLGVESSEAKSFRSNYELLVNQIDNARQSVQGVSLDEEMANLVKFQHAYDAAARVITTMDEALDTVIYNMGIVGR
jgi:flagellar hook-associated protein 1 FlgK